jgi:hypothetical protein
MNAKPASLGWIHRILILFVIINIIGDFANIGIWWVNPDSAGSLNMGYIGTFLGVDSALIVGTVVLLVVALVYVAALFGLVKRLTWAPPLVIAISVANRVLAVPLYLISIAFIFWLVWTVILVVVAYLDWRKMKAAAKAPAAPVA